MSATVCTCFHLCETTVAVSTRTTARPDYRMLPRLGVRLEEVGGSEYKEKANDFSPSPLVESSR